MLTGPNPNASDANPNQPVVIREAGNVGLSVVLAA